MIRTIKLSVALWLGVTLGISSGGARGDEPVRVKAPANHAVLADSMNGWFFAPIKLKQEYDQVLDRLETLQSSIDEGKLTAAEAQLELTVVRDKLESLRRDIEASKVHVAAAKIHEQTATTEFDLGPERILSITANQVRLVGWEGPRVKCELRRFVLATDDKPVTEHLDAIQVLHEHAATEFAGKTDAEFEAEEQKYLEGDGAKLTPEQRAGRRALVDDIRRWQAIYAPLRGRSVDQIRLSGLAYDQNESIMMAAVSEGGEGRYGGVRRRYGTLTVYVPKCQLVCVRGARRGLVVEDLQSPLIVAGEESTDENHRARFEIHGVAGDLTVRDFPLQVIERIEGRVQVEGTQDFGSEGGGTTHSGGQRDMHPSRPMAVSIRDVEQGVSVWYGRAKLELRGIGGPIDVRNDFGDTRLTIDRPLADAAHRVISQAGRIDVRLAVPVESPPTFAVTNHGGVRTNLPQASFPDFHLVTSDIDHARRNWSGFRSSSKDDGPLAVFDLRVRFQAALDNGPRPSGLDLISRSGSISLLKM